MSIESVLTSWAAGYSGIPVVVHAPFAGDRQKEPYISYQLLSFDYSDFDDKNRVSKDADFVTHNYENWAKLLVSIHCYGDKAYSAINKLRLSLYNWQSNNLLKSENMALRRAGAATNLAALEQTSFRQHWHADFEFNILLTNSIDVDKIKTWMLERTWTDGNNNIFNSTINYP